MDVYEWERDGTGSCQAEAGCVYLLSSGDGTTGSYLLDASANGNDVFIITRDPLVEDGQGEDYAVYDARVDGFVALIPPACTGTGCQGVPAAPPTFATPSSVTFGGVGNFPPPTTSIAKPKPKSKKPVECKRGYEKKKGKCIRKTKVKTKKSAKGRK